LFGTLLLFAVRSRIVQRALTGKVCVERAEATGSLELPEPVERACDGKGSGGGQSRAGSAGQAEPNDARPAFPLALSLSPSLSLHTNNDSHVRNTFVLSITSGRIQQSIRTGRAFGDGGKRRFCADSLDSSFGQRSHTVYHMRRT
jgi:hypothetical protein